MKNVFILMLGLVAGTASFAQTTETKTLVTSVSITNDQKLKLVIGRENSTAVVTLRDPQGHVLYRSSVNLREGLLQKFDLNQLDKGLYQLAVTVGDDVITKAFVIDDQPAQKIIAFRS